MFSNLNAEMGRAKLSIKSLSELTGINYETLKLKFRGVTEFKLCERVEIKRKAFPDKGGYIIERYFFVKKRFNF